MPLTPEEIEGADFVMAIRGYNTEAVHAFLERVAVDYREALGRAAVATDDVPGLGDRVTEVIRAAVDAARQVRAQAEAEAASRVRAAEEDAARISDNAREDREAAREALSNAEKEAERVRASASEMATEEIRALVERARAQYASADRFRREFGERLESAATSLEQLCRHVAQADLQAAFDEVEGTGDASTDASPR